MAYGMGCVWRQVKQGIARDRAEGLRGFGRNHGNVESPGRFLSDWPLSLFYLAYITTTWRFTTPRKPSRLSSDISRGMAKNFGSSDNARDAILFLLASNNSSFKQN